MLVIIALVFLLPNQSQDNSTPTESETKLPLLIELSLKISLKIKILANLLLKIPQVMPTLQKVVHRAAQLLMRITNPQLKVIPSIPMGVLVIALRILITILFPMFQKMDQGSLSKITTMKKLESMYVGITILREKHSMSVSQA